MSGAGSPGIGVDGSGVRVVIVEDASRLARKLLVQELGLAVMQRRGVRVLTSRGDDLSDDDDETKVMLRQIVGSFDQLEKARLVKKLKGARDRKSAEKGQRIEGRKRIELAQPELNREAKRLARVNPVTHKRRSLREIATELAKAGYVNSTGKAYAAAQVARFLDRETTAARRTKTKADGA